MARVVFVTLLVLLPVGPVAASSFYEKLNHYCEKLLSKSVLSEEEEDTKMMSAKEVIELLDLAPLPGEGGFFKETYRSEYRLGEVRIGERELRDRSAATSIYYLVTPETFSSLHRLPQDEVFYFHAGEPAEMLIILPDGNHKLVTLGTDFRAGHRAQVVVPAGSWQGTRLAPGSKSFALLGTSVSPGFEFADLEIKCRKDLITLFPDKAELIRKYTLED